MTRPVRRPGEGCEDVDLLARLRNGDRAALVALHDRLGGRALALARRMLADDVLAEDVVQDVFLAVWCDPGGYEPVRGGGVASSVLAAVHQRAVAAVRREQPQRHRSRDGDARPAAPAAVRHPHGSEVADEEREALVLACYGGYTQREVAALTGVRLDTARMRMLAGVRRLRQEMGGLAGAVPGVPGPADGAGR